jgi:hypothetical protein
VQARDTLLERTVSFFTADPDASGIFLAGSLPAALCRCVLGAT